MLSKISNTATKETIEKILQSKFDYGELYKPRFLINGLKESTVCILTAQAPNRIQFGIWGILPKGYTESWKTFQSIHNTLEIEFEYITEISWLYDALKNRRCLIVATGYFTAEIKNQSLITFHNISKNNSLFCFAGIYNILEDGFISCSILTHQNGSSKYLLKNPRPIIIKEENYSLYLNSELSNIDICGINFEMEQSQFLSYKIAKYNHFNLNKE